MSRKRIVSLLVVVALVGLVLSPVPAQAGLTINRIWKGIRPKADARYVQLTAAASLMQPTNGVLATLRGDEVTLPKTLEGTYPGDGIIAAISFGGVCKVEITDGADNLIWKGSLSSCTTAPTDSLEWGHVQDLPDIAYTGPLHVKAWCTSNIYCYTKDTVSVYGRTP